MDWEKLSAKLAAAVSKEKNDTFFVLIRFRLPLDDHAIKILSQLGITRNAPYRETITAKLDKATIEKLSDQFFVYRLSLAGQVSLHQTHPGSVWINNNLETLVLNGWVAADGNGVVAHSLSFDGLMKDLKDKSVELKTVAIFFNQTYSDIYCTKP